jgi:OOP family OmpA-OmpF porin
MNDLDQLKTLLFGAEKQALDSITERVGRREARTADVAEILPEAIHQSHKSGVDLVESLTEPVGECVRRALHDDPETFSNALYPVMGPALRKSIMATLRNFAQQLNAAVEHSVSPKGLKWRWQASRAGIPFGEFLLQKTLQYRVEQAYLISRENGLLIGHVHHEASKIKDSDAVSAMFTAIQDFVKESFSPDRSGRLESADMGEFTLWAIHGPHALLVCVIRGVPPKAMRADLSAILERIHFRYGDAIREYKGDTASVAGVEADLERCLRLEAHRDREKRGSKRLLWIAALVLLLVVVGLSGYRSWTQWQQFDRLRAALASTPGIHITEIERNGAEFAIRGLRDPLAMTVQEVATAAQVDTGLVTAEMQPFQSLQPEIIEARARSLLAPPSTARLAVNGSTLVISGDASSAWRRQVEARHASLAGISSLDISALKVSDQDAPGLPDQDGIAARTDTLNKQTFRFASDLVFAAGAEDGLRRYAEDLRSLCNDAAAAGYLVDVTLYGSTDASGGEAANAELARRRADVVANLFAEYEVPVLRTRRLQEQLEPHISTDDPSWRFVRIDLSLRPIPKQQ